MFKGLFLKFPLIGTYLGLELLLLLSRRKYVVVLDSWESCGMYKEDTACADTHSDAKWYRPAKLKWDASISGNELEILVSRCETCQNFSVISYKILKDLFPIFRLQSSDEDSDVTVTDKGKLKCCSKHWTIQHIAYFTQQNTARSTSLSPEPQVQVLD